ncbi:MAG: Fur family transcriptional regulator [Candidatus Tumulicola sp.]
MRTRAEYSTRPRELIANVLHRERRFLTAGDIQHELDGVDAKVALSTIYRTLEHLKTRGAIATRIDDAGEAAYIYCEPDHHHHHAICRTCGRVEDVDCTAMEQFAHSVLASSGFALDGHDIEFTGTCATCR